MKSSDLLLELTTITQDILREAKAFKAFPMADLNAQPAPGRWSALECLEHLNRYGDFYIPEIENRLNASPQNPNATFTAGLLGNYFANAVKPGARNMNTFNNMNPSKSALREAVLDVFIEQQNTFLDILNRCANYDLNKVKTNISISKWIKLRLGDTLRVVIYHNQRHMQQAQCALPVAVKNEKAAV